MAPVKSGPKRTVDESFLHTVATLLEQTFGFDFDCWLPEVPWQRLELRGELADVTPPAGLGEVLRQVCEPGHVPVYAESSDGSLLAIPVRRRRELVFVATASPPPVSNDPARLAAAFLRELELREELDMYCATTEAYAVELSRCYEEITLLRRLAEYLDLADVSKPCSELADTTLALLREAIGAEWVLWVASESETPGGMPGTVAVGKVVERAGPGPLDPTIVQCLVERYRTRAAVQPVVRNGVQHSADRDAFPDIREFVLVEATAGERIMGWMLAVNRLPLSNADATAEPSSDGTEFGSVEAGLVDTVAAILATHARNMELFREKEETFLGAVRSLVGAVEAKDQYTRGHSERVGLFARRLGEQLQLPQAVCARLYLCGLLHDVGKIAIQGATLRKPGRLTDEEFDEIKQHPERGWEILYDLDRLQYVLPAVVHHHEHYDGTGYPDGLAGDDIPLAARILAVADTYDALTSDRPYRQGMAQEKAEAILCEGSGTQWEPRIVDAAMQVMPDLVRIRREYQPRRPPQRQTALKSKAADTALPANTVSFPSLDAVSPLEGGVPHG